MPRSLWTILDSYTNRELRGMLVTFFNTETRSCDNCDQISYLSKSIPKINDNFERVISPQTAYQITSMLEGVIKRGTGKRLKNLNTSSF